MHQAGISAYIAEPGSNAMYFANISVAQWHPSERPFLIIITPSINSKHVILSEQRSANVTILAPRFEIERAKKLVVPYDDDDDRSLSFIDWAEDEDPFVVLHEALSLSHLVSNDKIVLDDGMRKFVADGLAHAGFSIKDGGYPAEIARLREQKSDAELDIMRCANEVRSVLA